MSTINRTELQRAATLVRPALAAQPYIPALTHIRFDGKHATAYDDKSAIAVHCEVDVKRLVPGVMLVQALGSFGGGEVLLQQAKDEHLVISSGRAKVKLPTLPVEDFPFDWPAADEAVDLPLDADILRGIERCLISVGTDAKHPAQMGVTLDRNDAGRAVLYSTDDRSISRFTTGSKVRLPGDAPVILPRFFCEQLAALRKAFPDEEPVLLMHADALVAEFGDKARLFSRLLDDASPLDFPAMFAKHVDEDRLDDILQPIPDSFDAALGRALLVLGGEAAKQTTIECGKKSMSLHSQSTLGDADDSCEGSFGGMHQDAVKVDPSFVARAAKVSTRFCVTSRCTIFAGEPGKVQFLHMIAHVE